MEQYTYLAHHGIKGQKWYQRRFQNEDGSLTSLGRLRYGVGSVARGGIYDGSKTISKRAKKLAKFGSALGKAKAEQYGQSIGRAMRDAKTSARSLSRAINSQKTMASELMNHVNQLNYYTKKNSAVRSLMQRYADVAYLSDRRFETRMVAGRDWISNALSPAQHKGPYTPSARSLFEQYVPITRDLQESFGAAVSKSRQSSKDKIKSLYGMIPNNDTYKKYPLRFNARR